MWFLSLPCVGPVVARGSLVLVTSVWGHGEDNGVRVLPAGLCFGGAKLTCRT